LTPSSPYAILTKAKTTKHQLCKALKMKQPNIDRNQRLIAFYLSGKSLRETGNHFGISFQRVEQILKQNKIPKHKYIIYNSFSQIQRIA
jgi:DNA-directed RNA polymerase specialized sigma subunit